MDETLQKIDNLRSILDKLLPLKPDWQKKLDEKFRLEFNYNSNHLEGNTLTYGETKLLLLFDGAKGNHTFREYEEMKAHDVALQLIKEWAADAERPLTETEIKALNEIILVKPFWKDALTPEGRKTKRKIKVGAYKESPNSVRLSNGEIFEYASVTDTPMLMEELMKWYQEEVKKNELHVVALASLLHYKFVRIHPFDDGNGRISRLLMNYVLYKNNFPPVVIKSTDKKNYLSALNAADSGDIHSFIRYIANQVIWSLELSIRAAKGENINDADDLDKEIAVWKKQTVHKSPQLAHRNNQWVYEIYTHGIREMFEKFLHKLEQFYELFENTNSFLNVNDAIISDNFEDVSDEINKIYTRHPDANYLNAKSSELPVREDSFSFIKLKVSLERYKYNIGKPFDISIELQVNFYSYKYELIMPGVERKEKVYGEYTGIEEREQLLEKSVQHLFAEIKSKAEA